MELLEEEVIYTHEDEDAYHVRISSDCGISFDDVMTIKEELEEDFNDQQNRLRDILSERETKIEEPKRPMNGFYISKNAFAGKHFIICVIEKLPMSYNRLQQDVTTFRPKTGRGAMNRGDVSEKYQRMRDTDPAIEELWYVYYYYYYYYYYNYNYYYYYYYYYYYLLGPSHTSRQKSMAGRE